ncbi:MAG: hypothetical protein GC190_15935 [Alphaproteobacteria bacterium]|nr:hypothetical protein [Alphaproteobacteria bacterium]
METFAACGAAFLISVLWFDLMFDVQVRGTPRGQPIPAPALQSIASYYRRVTTDARPMNLLVAAVMLATLMLLVAELATGSVPVWIAGLSLAAALSAIGFARVRIVPDAVRLGRGADTIQEQSRLARSIFLGHLYCLGAMVIVLALQLGVPWLA